MKLKVNVGVLGLKRHLGRIGVFFNALVLLKGKDRIILHSEAVLCEDFGKSMLLWP